MTALRPGTADVTPGLSSWRRVRRWWAHNDRGHLVNVLLLTLLCLAAIVLSSDVAVSVLIIPMVVGGLTLAPKRVPAVVGICFVLMVLVASLQAGGAGVEAVGGRRWFTLGTAFVVGLSLLLAARHRAELGVPGGRGESMLLELREGLNRHGELPVLPPGWFAEAATRSAGGASFAGDFMVTRLSPDRHILNVTVVDVSGKGVDAGTRALLLSGAFGGLLGALPSEAFLPEANRFLLQQEWEEGFATAVHLRLDLDTGEFELRSAGHPPPVQLVAGSGRWLVHDALEGPVLGVVESAEYPCVRGRLRPGDALFLYTDGLVEKARRDISLGIDRLLGEGERLLRRGFVGAADSLVGTLGSSHDDCALLLIQRVGHVERMTGIEPG